MIDSDATTPDSRPSSSLHGRFEPGARLGTRYRVVGLLGRGGMGEVYRADDLELNHPVALKLLPEHLARSADDLARLRQEVRITRQIAHPNVCRTYDIAEADGQVFVVMEYVDGEDLGSVLRRLGRPTADKAVEIARGICLGLGAAHELGVIHRDLKPSNIMIDGRGRVRVMDFGIAGTVEELAGRGAVAGTPEYMAPEQRRDGAATVQTDIYSLGLVLFEIFTGKRASEMMTPAPKDKPGTDTSIRPPSSVVPDIDPAVERVILRCLAPDPAHRPQSAYAVFGALPGSDPLAAAVAAGETPSPDLVANAGQEGKLPPLWAGVLVAVILAGLLTRSILDRPYYGALTLSSKAQSTRAEEIATRLTGAPMPHYSAAGFRESTDSIPVPQFWRRWSPEFLEPPFGYNGTVVEQPPPVYAGSATVVLDRAGRLVGLYAVPDPSRDSTATPPPPPWEEAIRATGRDATALTRVATPPSFHANADSIAAWSVGGAGDTTLVVASLRGHITSVDHLVKGTRLANLDPAPTPVPSGFFVWFTGILYYVLPAVASIVLARRNIRKGRVDLRGLRVAGVFTVVISLLAWLLSRDLGALGPLLVTASLVSGAPLGEALMDGSVMALAYLAIEPFVRRLWPGALVSWARIGVGRLRDPIIGRDILVGAALGMLWSFGPNLQNLIAQWTGVLGVPYPTRFSLQGEITPLFGVGSMLSNSAFRLVHAMKDTAVFFTVLVVLRALLRRSLPSAIAIALIFTLWGNFESNTTLIIIHLGVALLFNSLFTWVALRFGFVAAIAAIATIYIGPSIPWTTDLGAWYGPQVIVQWMIALVVVGFAFVAATGTKSIFVDVLEEPVGERAKI